MVLFVATKHPWAKNKVIEPGEILDHKFVSMGAGTVAYEFIKQCLERVGIDPKENRFFIGHMSIDNIKDMVLKNEAYSILSRYAVDKELKNGSLVEIRIEGISFKRQVKVIYQKTFELPQIYAEFISFIT
jgi:DNA-binding transcriptional LysR family regulator